MTPKTVPYPGPANMLLLLFLFCAGAHAQNTLIANASTVSGTSTETSSASLESSSSIDNPNLPDAPQTTTPASSSSDQGQQTKRILGIFPNFRAVSANVHLPPQTVKEKFITASQDSFDYSSILLPAAVAGYDQATNDTPEFRQGAAGYGRYFWHTYVDQTSENYFVEFIVPVITHEDTRYYTLGSGGFFKRAGYSLSRAVITRNDDGHDTFNISEVVGAGAAAGISNLYYPSRERTFSNTADKWGENVGIDAATFLFHEFWPDVNHALFHGKKSN
ncbi:hypothetical protein [Granulicella sp. L60]|jgi:hypothetical protein|uniref:hypothetical protein n=1 Tax=Granulicella sp. L60 TaxID=1641866 RepID=UPI0020B171FD|nr:hypothetical protein [Granulicella sp. L60]